MSWNSPLAKLERKKVFGVDKSFYQSLSGHTEDCLRVLRVIFETNRGGFSLFCKRWGLEEKNLLRNLFWTVYMHDVGKLVDRFQRDISEGKHSTKCPHAFFSLPLILEAYTKKALIPILPYGPYPLIELCAVFGHHRQLHSDIYDSIIATPNLPALQIASFLDSIGKIHEKLGFAEFFDLETPVFEPSDIQKRRERSPLYDWILKKKRTDLIQRSRNCNDKTKLKAVYSLFHSTLKHCDFCASKAFREYIRDYDGQEEFFNSVLDKPEIYVPKESLSGDKILRGNLPYEFQRRLFDDPQEFCLLFAPCGRGKTEAALLWASKICAKTGRDKVVFALPTQITSNAMRERFIRSYELDRGNVGIFHGRSLIKLKEERLDEDGEITPEDQLNLKQDNFEGEVFFRPFTVTTIDHLVYSFVHGYSQADFSLGNLQNSVVIFDEIHYYEQHTLEVLLSLFKIMQEMRIPHLLMSGTLPEFLVEAAKQVNPKYAGPILDDEGLRFEPFRMELLCKPLIHGRIVNKKALEEIVRNYQQDLTQFIILNTVGRSQILYKTVKEALEQVEANPNILLHNSRFTYRDRVKKEDEIRERVSVKPFVLVATQVIEISLDISSDIMYTELAPPDALGQRGGRLNRGKRSWKTGSTEYVMKVFLGEELFQDGVQRRSPYPLDLLEKTRAILENKPYSYLDLKKMCDTVYADRNLTPYRKLEDLFDECTLFGYPPSAITHDTEESGKLLKIRTEEYREIDAIPSCYYDGNESLRVENQAKIPLWWYLDDVKNHGVEDRCFSWFSKKVGRREEHYLICRIPYNSEIGFDYASPDIDSSDGNII